MTAKHSLLSLVATGLLLAAPAMAQPRAETWRPVELREPSAQEMEIVRGVYGEFLRGASDTRVQVARVDIDNDRTAELVVRMTHPRLCGPSGCHTALLQGFPSRGRLDWQPMLERRSTTIELGGVSDGNPPAVRIRLNGREIWEAGPNGLFTPRLDSFGRLVELQANLPAPVLRAAVAAANRESGAQINPRGNVFGALERLGDAGEFWLVQVAAGAVCGQVGCPVYVISNVGQPRVVAQFSSLEGALAVGRWPGGEGLIAAASPPGVTLFAFANGRLAIRETTFPSQATPAP